MRPTMRPAIFAALLNLTRAGSAIGDLWIQSDYCARVKGATNQSPVVLPGPDGTPVSHGTAHGRRACAWHCLTYTTTQALIVGAGARALGIRVHPGAATAALAISGITHYVADRRVPGGVLEMIATRTGKGSFWRLADHGLNGAFELDQAWHHGWETAAALVATISATTA